MTKGKDREYFFSLYREYLKSEKWHKKRKLVMERDKGICQSCLSTQATQVHHKSYKNVFDEPLFDLVAICDPCHERYHDKKTWQRRGIAYNDRKTVSVKGKIGCIVEEVEDELVLVAFRDGSEGMFLVWELTYYE